MARKTTRILLSVSAGIFSALFLFSVRLIGSPRSDLSLAEVLTFLELGVGVALLWMSTRLGAYWKRQGVVGLILIYSNSVVAGVADFVSDPNIETFALTLFGLAIAALLSIPAIVALRAGSPEQETRPQVVEGVVEVEEIAAGWYPDPSGNPSERFWDGKAWLNQTRPMTIESASRARSASMHTKRDQMGRPVSERSRLVTLLLCMFLGLLGIHRFYSGKTGTGLAQLFTLGGLGLWTLVDFFLIIAGAFRDASGKPITDWSVS